MKYSDLHHVGEDERIRIIGEAVLAGNITGVAVDDEPEKIARYKRKLAERYPTIRLFDQHKGPTRGAVILRYGPGLDA